MGVMGWLFGGAVKNLGSPEHMDQWFHPLKVSVTAGKEPVEDYNKQQCNKGTLMVLSLNLYPVKGTE